MVETIDRSKRDPLGISRSHIATIHHPGLETMKATLNRGSTVQVPRDSVSNVLRRRQPQQVSVPEMISNSLQIGLVPHEAVCQHVEGEFDRQVQEC
jgi:hypothetical protein